MPKLFATLLGRNPNNQLFEEHRLVHVVAENETAAKTLAKEKWPVENVHVDSVQELTNVDDYQIRLEKSDSQYTTRSSH
ncbi:DUF1543 domain-containing protein [Patescibacteria group bacterium]|nr:MAG: DUF1543 domain-containing protein [Patescibacteria group bacterium]